MPTLTLSGALLRLVGVTTTSGRCSHTMRRRPSGPSWSGVTSIWANRSTSAKCPSACVSQLAQRLRCRASAAGRRDIEPRDEGPLGSQLPRSPGRVWPVA
jgi:hypothetical protein